MKECRGAKDRDEAEKRKESGMCLSHPLCRAVTMAHYGPTYVEKRVSVLFGLGDRSLEWRLGARFLLLRS